MARKLETTMLQNNHAKIIYNDVSANRFLKHINSLILRKKKSQIEQAYFEVKLL